MHKKILLLLVTCFLIWSCSDDDEISKSLNTYDHSVIEYFQEVALGFEFGNMSNITRKWKTEMKIYVGGTKTPAMMEELQDIVKDINALTTDGFEISIVTDSLQHNFYIFLGGANTYAQKFPAFAGLTITNWGLFSVYLNANNEIYGGHMYVDIERANPVEERHLLREELTQALGLARDSNLYLNSIFQSSWTTTTAYAEIDEDLIRLLYHPQMQIGFDEAMTEDVLTAIILSEK